MRAFKSLLATVVIVSMGTSARADLTIVSVGDITLGNSWNLPVSFATGGSGFDLITVEVIAGGTFELDPASGIVGLGVANPSGWSPAWHSLVETYAEGPVHNGGFDLVLTFNDLPPDPLDVQVRISGFLPDSDSALGSIGLSVGATGWAPFFTSTSLTRSALGPAAAPVPGAVLLGVMGLGMVGVVKKRLV